MEAPEGTTEWAHSFAVRVEILAMSMDEAFRYGLSSDHLRMAIMCGLLDAYRMGFRCAMETAEKDAE